MKEEYETQLGTFRATDAGDEAGGANVVIEYEYLPLWLNRDNPNVQYGEVTGDLKKIRFYRDKVAIYGGELFLRSRKLP